MVEHEWPLFVHEINDSYIHVTYQWILHYVIIYNYMYVHTDKVLHLNVRCLDYIYTVIHKEIVYIKVKVHTCSTSM